MKGDDTMSKYYGKELEKVVDMYKNMWRVLGGIGAEYRKTFEAGEDSARIFGEQMDKFSGGRFKGFGAKKEWMKYVKAHAYIVDFYKNIEVLTQYVGEWVLGTKLRYEEGTHTYHQFKEYNELFASQLISFLIHRLRVDSNFLVECVEEEGATFKKIDKTERALEYKWVYDDTDLGKPSI